MRIALSVALASALAGCAPATIDRTLPPGDTPPPGQTCQTFGPDGVEALKLDPGGNWIAVVIAVPGAAGTSSRLWLANRRTLESRTLVVEGEVLGVPTLGNEGRLAWIQVGATGHTQIWEQRSRGQPSIQRFEGQFIVEVFEVPGGIIFGQDVGQGSTDYRMLHDDGATELVFTVEPRPFGAIATADGQLVVTIGGTGEQRGTVVTLHRGRATTTTTVDRPAVLYGFTPGEGGIVFGVLGVDTQLWTVPIGGGRETTLQLDAAVGAVDVGADGRVASAGPLLSPTDSRVCVSNEPLAFPQ